MIIDSFVYILDCRKNFLKPSPIVLQCHSNKSTNNKKKPTVVPSIHSPELYVYVMIMSQISTTKLVAKFRLNLPFLCVIIFR